MRQIARIRRDDGRVVQIMRADQVRDPSRWDNDRFAHVVAETRLDPARVYDYRDGQFVEAERSVEPRDVLAARYSMLKRLDEMSAGERTLSKAWAEYRQKLRDVTANGRTVSAMLRQFPIAPDGTDAVAHLRGSK